MARDYPVWALHMPVSPCHHRSALLPPVPVFRDLSGWERYPPWVVLHRAGVGLSPSLVQVPAGLCWDMLSGLCPCEEGVSVLHGEGFLPGAGPSEVVSALADNPYFLAAPSCLV